MLSPAAEVKLMAIARRLGQWEQDYNQDERNVKMWRTLARNPEQLKKHDDNLPQTLKNLQMDREKAKYKLPDIMTTIKQMEELCDMVLHQHKAAAHVPQIVKQPEVKKLSPKNKSVKKERCPNGTKKNTKTGKCEPK